MVAQHEPRGFGRLPSRKLGCAAYDDVAGREVQSKARENPKKKTLTEREKSPLLYPALPRASRGNGWGGGREDFHRLLIHRKPQPERTVRRPPCHASLIFITPPHLPLGEVGVEGSEGVTIERKGRARRGGETVQLGA